MGDLHEVVVDNVGKVVGGEIITLHDDEVLLGVLLLEAVVNNVVDHDGLLRTLESHSKPFPLVGTVIRRVRGDAATCARVGSGLAKLCGHSLCLLQ
jgi:hypothetical protein